MLPVEVSVKVTVKGATPEFGPAVKLATGARRGFENNEINHFL